MYAGLLVSMRLVKPTVYVNHGLRWVATENDDNHRKKLSRRSF